MPSHSVTEDWMGERVQTLEDLLRDGLRGVCVGINPSPVSVDAGHYYQGRAGQRFFGRLRDAGVLPAGGGGFEDDIAFAAGIGFTDIIKKPSASANELTAIDYQLGKGLLHDKLERYRPRLVIFTFKKTAEVLFGKFAGNGFVPWLRLPHGEVFVMPGTYESAETAANTMRDLAERWEQL